MSRRVSSEEVVEFQGMNKWRAKTSRIFLCNTAHDNVPTKEKVNDYVFYVSQSRDPERQKPIGQDCMAFASHGDWECVVLCDGHDRDGLFVSQGVCKTLPHIILRRLSEIKKAAKGPLLTEELVVASFEECANVVCWSSDDINAGDSVKIFSGKFAGKIGYVADVDDEDWTAIVVVDSVEEGYHRQEMSMDDIGSPRFHGGSTCITLIRNTRTSECRVAVLGDSRLMMHLGVEGVFGDADDDELMVPAYVENTNEEGEEEVYRPLAFFTPQHNVYNAYEMDRLKAEKGTNFQVDIQRGYLINPVTKFQIQPTRGFGDFEMHGTGYSHRPEVSNSFILPPNSIVLGASDGIFDGEIWQDDSEFAEYIQKLKKEHQASTDIARALFNETMKRCVVKDSIDDVSLFVLRTPRGEQRSALRTKINATMKMASEGYAKRMKLAKGSVSKSRRATINRSKAPIPLNQG